MVMTTGIQLIIALADVPSRDKWQSVAALADYAIKLAEQKGE